MLYKLWYRDYKLQCFNMILFKNFGVRSILFKFKSFGSTQYVIMSALATVVRYKMYLMHMYGCNFVMFYICRGLGPKRDK